MKRVITKLLLDMLKTKSTVQKHRELRREAVAKAHKVTVVSYKRIAK